MPQNKALAPLLAKGFLTVPRMWPGDAQSMRSQYKQTNK